MDQLLVCGNLNMDMIYMVDYLPEEGQSTPVRAVRREFGGCGGNISLAAAKLGVQVIISSVVGKDFDDGYLERLKDAGIHLEHIIIDDELPSPFCMVLSAPEGKQAYAFMEGAMGKQMDIEPPVPVKDRISHCHIATSHPLFTIRTARAMKEIGIPTAFDPGQEIYFRWRGPEIKEVLQNCDRFMGNIGEWEYLLDILDIPWEERSISGIVYPWSDRAFDLIDEAVITAGARGSLLIRRDSIAHRPAMEVDEVVDATGAGDAFRGGFYAALLRGIAPEDALLYGNAMGALSLSSRGPQGYDASWEKVLEMLKR
ncbi:MAG: carbohydrate kinase family protein [Candidatus Thermoplasmatota archaeon]|nr:carbohydrate kinase family protein [Candidatus Thermoplasmatota archaeon]